MHEIYQNTFVHKNFFHPKIIKNISILGITNCPDCKNKPDKCHNKIGNAFDIIIWTQAHYNKVHFGIISKNTYKTSYL